MNDRMEFERLNYFMGFFTTARDWEAEQAYHREKLTAHNGWLHNTPGIVGSVADELRVEAAGGLKVRVLPGAALDGLGHEIYLMQRRELQLDDGLAQGEVGSAIEVYIVIEYGEAKADYIENVEQPQYSGHSRIAERPRLKATLDRPDNQAQLELARIDLLVGAKEIRDPEEPDNPKANEIDRRYVRWSVTTAQQQEQLDDLQERLAQEEEKSVGFQEGLDRLDRECQLHNRGLHTPGIIRGEGGELRVKAAGGLDVQVERGAALDGAGNSIVLEEPRMVRVEPDDYELPQLVFIAVGQVEAQPDKSAAATVRLQVTSTKPDNWAWLELARVDLQPGVTEISDPRDPDHPRGNEIDRLQVAWAGAVGVVEKRMAPETVQRLIQVTRRTRRDFAALAELFPVPSAGDVRHAALTVETLACTGCLRPGQVADVLAVTAAAEQDAGQEIGDKYGNVVDRAPEFAAYQTAVQDLLQALQLGEEAAILNAQDAVAAAARELSELVVQSPIAEAGRDQTVPTSKDETTVTLDGSGSRARGGREVVRYQWTKEG